MNIVVDTNIIFSAILNPNGKIGDLLLDPLDRFVFFAPDFLTTELDRHLKKIDFSIQAFRKRYFVFEEAGFV